MTRHDLGGSRPPRRVALVTLLGLAVAGCPSTHKPPDSPSEPVDSYIERALRPWAGGRLAVTDPASNRFAVYDSALAVLVLLRRNQRDAAGRILVGLAALQYEDGGLPFSVTLPEPDSGRFVRSGAVAWVGYAATEYLDADTGGRDRDVALQVAHKAAAYLLAHRIAKPDDPRNGLVTGGEGNLRYEIEGKVIHEQIVPGVLGWISIEHNIDTYFFLRALGRVTEMPDYANAAVQIGSALAARAWREDKRQLARGVDESGIDGFLALDCASWGGVFLAAIGETERADTSFYTAERRYASHDPRTGVLGHLPYAEGPLLEDPGLQRFYLKSLPVPTWDRLDAVWPEGSAGVAFAALRTGHAGRAREILDALEPLRMPGGALPTFTIDIPYTFDTHASIAGTAWMELVRYELARGTEHPTLWVP